MKKAGIMSEAEKPDDLTMAIQTAKAYLARAYKDEKIENVGLEEVKHDEYGTTWDITLGFNRPREVPQSLNNFLQAAAAAAAVRPQRVYKVVKVDLNGLKGISISNRKDD